MKTFRSAKDVGNYGQPVKIILFIHILVYNMTGKNNANLMYSVYQIVCLPSLEIGGCLIAPRPYFKQTHTEQASGSLASESPFFTQASGSPMVPFFGVHLGLFDENGVR